MNGDPLIPGSRPVLYYRLNESVSPARDFTANANNGTWNGSLNTPVLPAGPLLEATTAYLFDGVSAYVDSGVTALDVSGTKPFTFACWVKPNTVDTTFRRILGREPALNQGCFMVYQSASGYGVVRGDSGGGNDALYAGTPTAGVWAYLVATYDGTTLRLYVNGTPANSIASSRSAAPGTATFRVGNTPGGASFAAAAIAEVAVFPVALSALQVANQYTAATTARGPVYPPVMQLVIGGVDLSKYVDQGGWSINQNWGRQGDTAIFRLYDEHPDQAVSLNFTVKPLSTITFKDLGLQKVIFGGLVGTPKILWQSPNLAQWELSCRDNAYYIDTFIVHYDSVNLRADQMINVLVAQFPGSTQPGGFGTTVTAGAITTNNVMQGPMIPRLKIGYQSLSQALNKITRFASTSGARYGWYLDENRDLHWYNQAQVNVKTPYFTDDSADSSVNAYHYDRSWAYLFDALALRNSAVIRGTNYTPATTQTDTWPANGQQTSFPVTFPPNTIKVVQATAYVGTPGALTQKSVGLDNGGPAQYQWLLTLSATGQWFLRVGTDAVPASGQIVVLTYYYEIPVLTQVDDLISEQSFNTLPNKGVFQVYITDQGLKDVMAAKARGQRELTEYSNPQERVEFVTTEDFTDHVRAGDVVSWKNAFVPDAQNSYLPGLKKNFFLVQAQIKGHPGNWRTYGFTGVRVS